MEVFFIFFHLLNNNFKIATLSLGFNNSNNQLFQWTPILKYNNNYYAYYQSKYLKKIYLYFTYLLLLVGIMGIYVNGSSLNLESSSYNRTIVDSGKYNKFLLLKLLYKRNKCFSSSFNCLQCISNSL